MYPNWGGARTDPVDSDGGISSWVPRLAGVEMGLYLDTLHPECLGGRRDNPADREMTPGLGGGRCDTRGRKEMGKKKKGSP